jgi:hypothetical protein
MKLVYSQATSKLEFKFSSDNNGPINFAQVYFTRIL